MTTAPSYRSILASKKAVWGGVSYDGLSSLIASQSGFDFVFLGGYALAGSLGLPDVGLTTQSEVVHAARTCVRASKLPVVVDGDTGYGNAINVMRTVREFEAAGVSGIQFEDQLFPKRCPLLEGNELIGVQEAIGKIKAAVAARQNPELVIQGRTDASNLDEAVRRSKAYVEAGADAVYVIVNYLTSLDQLREIRAAVGVPISFSMYGWAATLTAQEVESIGPAAVIWPFPAILTVAEALRQNYEALAATKDLRKLPIPMMDLKAYEKLVGFGDIEAAQQRFLPES